jgi:hypothetical protein
MSVRLGLIAAGLGLALAAGAGAHANAQGASAARAVLVLTTVNGTCGKALVGNDSDPANLDRIWSRRGGAIRWTVINHCDAAATVRLVNWVRKSDGAPLDPSVAGGRPECQALGVDRQCQIVLQIRGDAEATTYSYTVEINGTVYDPDVIIEM